MPYFLIIASIILIAYLGYSAFPKWVYFLPYFTLLLALVWQSFSVGYVQWIGVLIVVSVAIIINIAAIIDGKKNS
jgi:hypothetical protein